MRVSIYKLETSGVLPAKITKRGTYIRWLIHDMSTHPKKTPTPPPPPTPRHHFTLPPSLSRYICSIHHHIFAQLPQPINHLILSRTTSSDWKGQMCSFADEKRFNSVTIASLSTAANMAFILYVINSSRKLTRKILKTDTRNVAAPSATVARLCKNPHFFLISYCLSCSEFYRKSKLYICLIKWEKRIQKPGKKRTLNRRLNCAN